MNTFLCLALSAMLPGAGDDIRVTFVNEGFQYHMLTQVETTGAKPVQHTCFGFPKDTKPGFDLKPGAYTFLSRNTTSGFPQPVEYALKDAKGDVVWESGVTVDHKAIALEKGHTLEIRVQKPFVSYNSQKVRLAGIDTPVMIVGARPYWFYFAGPKEFPLDAPETYPNGIFFLADPKWGVEGVAKDLARKVFDDLQDAKQKSNDHRGTCHWSLLHATTPDGDVPAELRKVKLEEWQKAIMASFESMLKRNYYRPFEVQTVRQLKAANWLPKETPDRPMVITLLQGVEFGKIYREGWLKMRAEEKKAAEKKD